MQYKLWFNHIDKKCVASINFFIGGVADVVRPQQPARILWMVEHQAQAQLVALCKTN